MPDSFIKYEMLGFPADLVKEVNSTGLISIHCVSIEVEARELTAGEVPKPHLFYGLISDVTQSDLEGLSKIDGMSGGPIFGFAYKKSELRYWIVALQSTKEGSDPHKITGFCIRGLCDFLDAMITDIRTQKALQV